MIKKILYILTGKQKIGLILVLFMILLGALLELIGVSAILPLVNLALDPEIISGDSMYGTVYRRFRFTSVQEMIIFCSVSLIVIYFLKNVYLIFMNDVQYRFIYSNQKKLAARLMNNYVNRDYLFHTQKNVADLHRNIMGDVEQTYRCILSIIQLITEVITCLFLVAFLFVTDKNTTILVFAILIIALMLCGLILKKIQVTLGAKLRESSGKLNKTILETFGGIKIIKADGIERFFLKIFNDDYQKYVNIQRKNQIRSYVPRPIMETICICTVLAVLSIQLINGTDIKAFIPMLSILAASAMRMLPAFNRITNYLSIILFIKPSVDNIYNDLIEIEYDNIKAIRKMPEKIITFKNKIIFQNVSFSYVENNNYVLKNAYMEIPVNKSVAIIGESGSGKSTIADLLLGLLKPNEGEILCDGVDIFDGLKSWHDMVGYIPQTIYLTDDTIRHNVAFGLEESQIDDEMVMNAINEAHLGDFINGLADGINTKVGERGVLLSGGQKQRIGIARALYKNPPFLILDEATSSLDNDTEKSVMEAIDSLSGKKTLLIIAHRLSTIENCDIIYEVKNHNVIRKDKL